MAPDQKSQMATVGFQRHPDSLPPDKKEWSIDICQDENNESDDDNDVFPAAPTITFDTHFKGITVLRSFKEASEHEIE